MGHEKRQKVIIVAGPTTSGKSALAIKLAKKFNGEIISADSRQVYRGMDIGTGKILQDKILPVPKSKFKNQNVKLFYSEGIRHHLLDVASPKKQFTVDDFKRLGQKAIIDIASRYKVPIICGGTGLYADVLIYDLPIPHVPPNCKLRTKLEKLSAEKLYSKLLALDPGRAVTIDRHNPRRLIRALEIVIGTGKPVPNLQPITYNLRPEYDVLFIGINPDKKRLAKRIEKRLDERLKTGMIQEVKKLHKSGISWKRLESFGLEYRHLAKYLQGKYAVKMLNVKLNNQKTSSFDIRTSSFQAMRNALLGDIIRYSKRQMTWFKRNKNIHWIHSQKAASSLVQGFLKI